MDQVFSLAKELVKLSLSGEEADPLTNLRLQKLLYYAQAWSLVVRKSEMFSANLEAWRHGPVVREVYDRLPDDQGANLISPKAFADAPDLQGEEAEFAKQVWEAYNQYSAIQLSKMTHKETPWIKAWGGRPPDGTGNDPISVNDLEEFFGQQAIPAPLAAHHHELQKREEEAERRLAEMPPIDAARFDANATSWTPNARLSLSRG